jgi:hypothetical protein
MYVVVGAQHAAPLLGTLATLAAYSCVHLTRKRKQNRKLLLFPLKTYN